MKIFDLVDLCEKFKRGHISYDHWRVHSALCLMEMDISQAKMIAEHIVDFRNRDNGDV